MAHSLAGYSREVPQPMFLSNSVNIPTNSTCCQTHFRSSVDLPDFYHRFAVVLCPVLYMQGSHNAMSVAASTVGSGWHLLVQCSCGVPSLVVSLSIISRSHRCWCRLGKISSGLQENCLLSALGPFYVHIPNLPKVLETLYSSSIPDGYIVRSELSSIVLAVSNRWLQLFGFPCGI